MDRRDEEEVSGWASIYRWYLLLNIFILSLFLLNSTCIVYIDVRRSLMRKTDGTLKEYDLVPICRHKRYAVNFTDISLLLATLTVSGRSRAIG
jgi:hypothetical protein